MVDAARGDRAVVELKAVNTPPTAEANDALVARISQTQASAEIAALIDSLRTDANIVVDEGQFQAPQ